MRIDLYSETYHEKTTMCCIMSSVDLHEVDAKIIRCFFVCIWSTSIARNTKRDLEKIFSYER